MADSTDSTSPSCASCGKADADLKRCAKCQTERYCSRDCQKAHWKTHKKVCASLAAGGATSSNNNASTSSSSTTPAKGLTYAHPAPFHALNAGTWLHNRPELDVYRLLIDAFRLRLDDDYKYSALNTAGSVYAGSSTSLPAFRTFLDRVEAKPGVLPPWWSPEKRAQCIKLGTEEPEDWLSLRFGPEKGDISEHYGNPQMPMQMRMFVESVYGSGPGGQDGTGMRQMMMGMEAGQGEGLATAMLDASENFRRIRLG